MMADETNTETGIAAEVVAVEVAVELASVFIFTSVLTDTFHHGGRAGIAHRETLARATSSEAAASGGPV